MSGEEQFIFDSYQVGRNLEFVTFKVPVGTRGAERNEFILWPTGIQTWPKGFERLDFLTVHLFQVGLEAERQGVFERIKAAHKGSGGGSGEGHMTLLDPVEHAEQFEEE